MILVVVTASKGQAQQPYYGLIVQAYQRYLAKDYKAAATIYEQAFSLAKAPISLKDRYQMACIWALTGNDDSAFRQLNILAADGTYTDYAPLIADKDLLNLHKDKRWATVCTRIKKNKDHAERKMNKQLIAELATVYDNDQKYRVQLDSVEKYAYGSPELTQIWQLINKTDSVNVVYISGFFDKYGWLGPDEIGKHGDNTLCAVIQHANLETQKKYAPLMKKAVLANKADPGWYALLEDRIALREGRKQIYGSQVHGNPNGAPWVSMMEDPDHVDERRASVGLPTMSEYLKQWNMTWDLKKYKKELPEIEAKDKW